MTTFLVTGAGGPAGSSVLRQLRERTDLIDARLIASDITAVPDSPADAFVQGPRAVDLELLPFLQRTIAEYNVDVFIPTVQDELVYVASAADVLGAQVVVSPVAAVALAHDKWLTAEALRAAGVAVPYTTAGSAAGHEFPCVVKPRVSRGGRGVVVVDKKADLPELDAGMIVQAFADGAEYCPQLYVHADGSITTVLLEKTKLRDGRVGNADAVERHEHDAAPEVVATAEATARALGLRGPLDMDIRLDSSGIPRVLEVNARFGANSAHAPELLSALLEEI